MAPGSKSLARPLDCLCELPQEGLGVFVLAAYYAGSLAPKFPGESDPFLGVGFPLIRLYHFCDGLIGGFPESLETALLYRGPVLFTGLNIED